MRAAAGAAVRCRPASYAEPSRYRQPRPGGGTGDVPGGDSAGAGRRRRHRGRDGTPVDLPRAAGDDQRGAYAAADGTGQSALGGGPAVGADRRDEGTAGLFPKEPGFQEVFRRRHGSRRAPAGRGPGLPPRSPHPPPDAVGRQRADAASGPCRGTQDNSVPRCRTP